jgi:hypothetical protein
MDPDDFQFFPGLALGEWQQQARQREPMQIPEPGPYNALQHPEELRRRLKVLPELALDMAPGIGDAKALAWDAPEAFAEGKPGLGLLAMASAIPLVPNIARMADDYPIRAFHGTKSDFTDFDLSKAGKSDPGLVGRALYFTPSEDQARAFAASPHYGDVAGGGSGRVIPVGLRMRNPLIIEDGVLPDGRRLAEIHPGGITPETGEAFQRELRAAGYDGVEFRVSGEPSQYVVFDPQSVKRTDQP